MVSFPLQILFISATTLYHGLASCYEDRSAPPGQLINIGSHRLHLYTKGQGAPTVILDHSLGGIEGYFLISKLSHLTQICIYDRAGYGWSDHSPQPRNSYNIVQELNTLLTHAGIQAPYILVGNSFGSYNVRLYAHLFPEKVVGLILTDGLHESGMLRMSLALKALKLFFISGFLMSIFGSLIGFVRVLRGLRAFEFLKPELRKFSSESRKQVKRSFCRPKHWITMFREMINLDKSAGQVRVANNLGKIPIVSIKANSFFKPSFWTLFIPLKKANHLRNQMHCELKKISSHYLQIDASDSGHFVWIDQPDVLVDAVQTLLRTIDDPSTVIPPEDSIKTIEEMDM